MPVRRDLSSLRFSRIRLSIDGKTVLEKGSAVSGRVVDVKKAGRVKGRATLSLALTSVFMKESMFRLRRKPMSESPRTTRSAMQP